MSIVRDDRKQRRIRVDQMIDEFRKAQSRRMAKATTAKRDDHVEELQRDARGQVAVARSTTAPTSDSNG